MEDLVARWKDICSSAETAEEHCAILAARSLPPHTAAVVYRVAIDGGRYAHLNREVLNAGQVAALARVRQADSTGLHAGEIPARTRQLLLRRELITAIDHRGQPASARDWAARLFSTMEGRAVASAALSRPVECDDALAAALIAVADAGSPGLRGLWPGARGTLLVAEVFGLVTTSTGAGGCPDWELTDEGRATLERWRQDPRGGDTPTPAQFRLLAELAQGIRNRSRYPAGTYEACERNGWLEWGSEPLHRTCHLTPAGAGACKRYQDGGQPARRRHQWPRVRVPEITAGSVVRLANRAGWRLGPEWVTVREVVHEPRDGGRPGGYWVMVAGPEGSVRSYGACGFHRLTKFEINTQEIPPSELTT